MKLRILCLLLVCFQTLFAQFDFKLSHTYDSLTVNRVQLYFSKKIRYVGYMERYDSIRQFYIDQPVYKIFDENHNFLKRVESKFPITKNPNSTHDKSLYFIGESANGKLLFYERTSTYYPIPNRVIDEDGNEALMDSIYHFVIDSANGLSPKAIKTTYQPIDGSYKIQYNSYPDLRFEKEYTLNKYEIGRRENILYRKKFIKAGEKFVHHVKDSIIQLLNLDHTLFKEIKLKVPSGYYIDKNYIGLGLITQDSNSVFRILYTALKEYNFGSCYTLNIKCIFSDENGVIFQESDATQLSGPPDSGCSNKSFGSSLSSFDDKIVYRNNGKIQFMNSMNLSVDTIYNDSNTNFPKLINIGKNQFYTWDIGDSTKFYDNNFKYKFTTIKLDYFSLLSDTLVNKDKLIEWFTGDTNRVKAINQQGKELFSCAYCSMPILSSIKNVDDNLILIKWGVNNNRTTLIYSKNLVSSVYHNNQNNTSFRIFPNPFSNDINIENYSENLSPFSIQLISSNGQILLSKKCNTKLININHLESFPNGLYFIKIENDKKESSVFKIMKI
jgi:hypothetical protein